MGVRAETIDSDAVLFHGDKYDSGALALFDGDRALLVVSNGVYGDRLFALVQFECWRLTYGTYL